MTTISAILVTASVALTPANCFTTGVLEGEDLCSQFNRYGIETSVTVTIEPWKK